MSWKSGSSLLSGIIEDLSENIDADTRVEVYKVLILNFEAFDCDTLSECLEQDNAFDRAWKLVGNEIEDDDLDYEDQD